MSRRILPDWREVLRAAVLSLNLSVGTLAVYVILTQVHTPFVTTAVCCFAVMGVMSLGQAVRSVYRVYRLRRAVRKSFR